MTKVAVILSGCGHLDGSEIRESIITLLELDKAGAEVSIFAPDISQTDVVNHLNGETLNEERNVLIESARIARGEVSNLKEASANNFDALILPGGYGAAKNLSSLASEGPNLTILPEFKNLILDFLNQGKPIGAICISPAVLVAAVKDQANAKVTIGDDADNLITTLGGTHQTCKAREVAEDDANNILSCPAYMVEEPLKEIAAGIEELVGKVINKAKGQKQAA